MGGDFTFQLDTSGEVRRPETRDAPSRRWLWSDLDPFTQGYIEALFAAGVLMYGHDACMRELPEGRKPWAFSDLAPETLSIAIERCTLRAAGVDGLDAEDGRLFWGEQQDGLWVAFPPVSVRLSDAGKVVFS